MARLRGRDHRGRADRRGADRAGTRPGQSQPATCRTSPVSGAIALVPVAIGIAIFRYHLYDIDVVINKTLVYGSLAVFITGVYVAIVVGIGSLAQRGTRPSLALSVAATAVVAVAFQPVRAWVQRLANRLVYGRRATPYQVLADFAGRMAGAYAAEDLLPRMARILAEGTGAARADVWLKTGEVFHDGAAWPPARRRCRPPGPPRPMCPRARPPTGSCRCATRARCWGRCRCPSGRGNR